MTETLLLALFLGIGLLLLLILRFKIPAFMALLVATMLIGIIAGQNPEELFATIQKGMGGTLGYVATIVGLGAMFGALLEVTGSAETIADYLLKIFGVGKAPWALLLSGFFIAIPVFFDVAFILLIPIIYALQHKTKKSLLLYAIPLLAGLAVTHAFIPPTPGPVAVSEILGAELGWVILMGFLVGLPTAIVSGIFFGKFVAKKIQITAPELSKVDTTSLIKKPTTQLVFSVVLLPIVLIVLAAVCKSIDIEKTYPILTNVLYFLGHPFAALLLANFMAWYFLGRQLGYSKEKLFKITSKSMEPAGTIILLTGAGGVLKQMLVDTEIGLMIATGLLHSQGSIYLSAFIMAVVVRILQGSSTVAMITAAGLVAPILQSNPLNHLSLALLVMAIASGASTFSHVNDSGFWLVRQYLGLNEKQTFYSWTMMTTILSITGFVMVLLISLLLSL